MSVEIYRAEQPSMKRRISLGASIILAHVLFLAACTSSQDASKVASNGEANDTSVDLAAPAISPPPPPSPSYAAQEQTVSVTASRISHHVPPVMIAPDPGRERYDGAKVSRVKLVQAEPVSTFSVDVDTGAYANTRRFLSLGQMPPRDAVRTEEMVNYFRYDYPAPKDRSQPFTVTTDLATSPWNQQTYLMRIGLRGFDLPRAERPPANLVFLMDVSGSMSSPDKLPLVKTALAGLAAELSENDRFPLWSMQGPPASCSNPQVIFARSALRLINCRLAVPPRAARASSLPTT